MPALQEGSLGAVLLRPTEAGFVVLLVPVDSGEGMAMTNRTNLVCRSCGGDTSIGRLRNHGRQCVQCYVPPKPQPRSRFGYHHPVRKAGRWLLRLKPCPCGCNTVYARGDARDWGDLTRVQKWATFDPDEVS